jgi:high-affinity nickel permease
MTQSNRKTTVILSIVALVVLVIAQGLTWLWEGRLNPGIFMGMAIVAVWLLSLRHTSPKSPSKGI